MYAFLYQNKENKPHTASYRVDLLTMLSQMTQ